MWIPCRNPWSPALPLTRSTGFGSTERWWSWRAGSREAHPSGTDITIRLRSPHTSGRETIWLPYWSGISDGADSVTPARGPVPCFSMRKVLVLKYFQMSPGRLPWNILSRLLLAGCQITGFRKAISASTPGAILLTGCSERIPSISAARLKSLSGSGSLRSENW